MKTFESQKNKEFIDEEKRYFHIVKSLDLSKIADAGTKEVAKKMSLIFTMSGFANTIEQFDTITRRDLEILLPDYVSGGDISKVLN